MNRDRWWKLQRRAVPLTALTLAWMNAEAVNSGRTSLNQQNATLNQTPPSPLTAAMYNAYPVKQEYSVSSYGITYTYALQYRNFPFIDPGLQCWQPGIADIQNMPLYTSQTPQFCNPRYQNDLVNKIKAGCRPRMEQDRFCCRGEDLTVTHRPYPKK
ncbi:MAG: hypothetical protein ABSC42_13390 [Tepidisphaeraceae bacterium]|jgi:hypothetical protein